MADVIVEKTSTLVSFIASVALVAEGWLDFLDDHAGAFGVVFTAVMMVASLYYQRRRDRREEELARKVRGGR